MAQAERDEKTWDFAWAGRYDAAVADDTRHYYAQYDNVLDAVVELANLAPGRRVLDIGTGTGNLAVRCLARGARAVGLDPSAAMLAQAQAKVGDTPGIEFRLCAEPFLQIPYPEASFDAVVSTYAFHHIPHRLKVKSVREMLRVLKPGGRWVLGDLVFENRDAETRALREFCWLEEEYFTRLDSLREAFTELGLSLQARPFTPVTWVLWAVKSEKEAEQ